MLLDTRIPLAAVQPRRSLTEDFAQALQIKAAQQQMAAQEAALAEKTQRKNALKGAIGPNGIDYEAAERIMLGLGDVEGAIGLRGQKLKEGEAQTKAASAEIELRAKQIEDEGRLLSGVRDAQSLEAARQQAAARGYDVSDWPTEYNPQLIDQAVRATMDPKTRYEIAAKEADNKAKQADRDRKFGLDERRTAAAEMRARNSGEPLVEVYDPTSETGTVFVPRSQAAGRAGKPPSGMEITLPDGTVVRQGRGAGSAAPGNDPLEKSVRTETQKDVITGTGALERLDEIANSYKSDYLTYGGRMRGGIASFADKAGMASDKQKDFVAGRRKFTQQVDQEFNAYRKDITGAAAAMAELESLKKAMINTDLGPAEFESAYNTYRQSVARMLRLKQAILRDGVPLGSRQFNKRLDDAWVSGADDSADARGAELEASGMPEAQVVRQLKREGYTR